MGEIEKIKGFESQGNTDIIGEVIKAAGMVADNKVEKNSIS